MENHLSIDSLALTPLFYQFTSYRRLLSFCLLLSAECSGCAVLLIPFAQSSPAVFCRFFAVAGAIVGIEAVWRVWVDDDFRFAVRCLECFAHLLYCFERDTRVFAAIQSEHGNLQGRSKVNRVCRLQRI